jgi:hypothetical protein
MASSRSATTGSTEATVFALLRLPVTGSWIGVAVTAGGAVGEAASVTVTTRGTVVGATVGLGVLVGRGVAVGTVTGVFVTLGVFVGRGVAVTPGAPVGVTVWANTAEGSPARSNTATSAMPVAARSDVRGARRRAPRLAVGAPIVSCSSRLLIRFVLLQRRVPPLQRGNQRC